MVTVQCVGRRRLEIEKRPDGSYEIEIVLTGPETHLATLLINPEEAKELERAIREE